MANDESLEVAVAGRQDIVAPFRAAGMAVFAVDPGPGAARSVQGLLDQGYRVVFFTEDLLGDLEPLLERYRKQAVPCLVALPMGGSRGGVARLKHVVRRAVGADVWSAEGAPGDGCD